MCCQCVHNHFKCFDIAYTHVWWLDTDISFIRSFVEYSSSIINEGRDDDNERRDDDKERSNEATKERR